MIELTNVVNGGMLRFLLRPAILGDVLRVHRSLCDFKGMLDLRLSRRPKLLDEDFDGPLDDQLASMARLLEGLDGLKSVVLGEVGAPRAPSAPEAPEEAPEGASPSDGPFSDMHVSLEQISDDGRRYPLGFDGHTLATSGSGCDIYAKRQRCAALTQMEPSFRESRMAAILLPPGARLLGVAYKKRRLHLRIFHSEAQGVPTA
jgi:hypothetical protein